MDRTRANREEKAAETFPRATCTVIYDRNRGGNSAGRSVAGTQNVWIGGEDGRACPRGGSRKGRNRVGGLGFAQPATVRLCGWMR